MMAARLRSLALGLTILLMGVFTVQRLDASELLESGPNYFVVQNDAGGTTGSVIMRMDLSFDSDNELAVNSRILSITAEPGWTWVVRKAGGVNKAVEVQFSKGAQRFTFKALYAPGRTIIDGGVIK